MLFSKVGAFCLISPVGSTGASTSLGDGYFFGIVHPFIMWAWSSHLKFDPAPPLLRSSIRAITYLAERDLMDRDPGPSDVLWGSPEVRRLERGQRENGSWPGPKQARSVYPPHHYELAETWKRLRLLVERYELDRTSPVVRDACEFLLSCQTEEGDIRGMLGNQYATYFTGAMMAVLIKAGYGSDPRIGAGFRWLLSMRQNDGGWTIPVLTKDLGAKQRNTLAKEYAEPLQPDRTRPSSHNWTDMVLRAFAEHPELRGSKEALAAARLLKGRFFQEDPYPSYQEARYWTRFHMWWPNLLTALQSLRKMGFTAEDPDVNRGLGWFIEHQAPEGTWRSCYDERRDPNARKEGQADPWVSLAIARLMKQYYR